MITPVLGKSGGHLVKVAESAMNNHVLITGKSGSGKTYALQLLERKIAEMGGDIIVLSFNGTHENMQRDVKSLNFFTVREKGIPLQFLTPIDVPNGVVENCDEVADQVLDIFCNVGRFGIKQKITLRKAITFAIENQLGFGDELQAIARGLKLCDCDESEIVYDRFWNLFHQVRVSVDHNLIDMHGITILDLSGYSGLTQKLLTELALATLWRYFKIWGQFLERPIYIVLDEFQQLNLKEESIVSQILREGRKFNFYLLLATQTIVHFDKGVCATLQQAGTQLYFRPADSEITSIAKMMPSVGSQWFKDTLKGLQKGECVAVGRFDIAGQCIERPIKIII